MRRRTCERHPLWINAVHSLLAVLALSCGVVSADMTAGTNYFSVVKPLSIPITSFKSAYVTGDDGSSVALWLGRNNIQHVFTRQEADLEVRCQIESGGAPPRLGRHFDVIAHGLKKINIRLINTASNDVLGEITYDRPRLKWDLPYICDRMLDRLTEQHYGLTDFTKWEKRTFQRSGLTIDVPAGFRNVGQTSHPGNRLSLYMHLMPFDDGGVQPQLFITVEDFDPTRAEDEKTRILKQPEALNDPEYARRFAWELSYQPQFTNMPEFPVNGPWMIYLRDARTGTGSIVRARASLNIKLRSDGYSIDERAIRRIFESLEVQ